MKKLYDILNDNSKKVAILVDPDKMNSRHELEPLLKKVKILSPDFILVGGSTVSSEDFENCIRIVKEEVKIPVLLFPGSSNQVSGLADGILFLSLISGRNPDYLIGHQVESAPIIKRLNIETIPTGYLLIDGGKTSSVAYVSQTTPIPEDQTSIAVNTAIAGEMLGLKAIFLDAGSGAKNPVSSKMIAAVKQQTSLPVIVGGGIKTIHQINAALGAGADLVVIGNKVEEDENFLFDIKTIMSSKNLISKN